MTVPWIAAFVALWAVVILALLILLGLLRRVSITLEKAPTSDFAQVEMQSLVRGLPIGASAPVTVEVTSRSGMQVSLVALGQWNLVVLISVACSHCKSLAAEMADIGFAAEGVRTVVVIEDTEAGHDMVAGIADLVVFQTDEAVGHAFETTATPYAFLIDPSGVIRARSHPNNVAALHSLVAAAHASNGADGLSSEMRG